MYILALENCFKLQTPLPIPSLYTLQSLFKALLDKCIYGKKVIRRPALFEADTKGNLPGAVGYRIQDGSFLSNLVMKPKRVSESGLTYHCGYQPSGVRHGYLSTSVSFKVNCILQAKFIEHNVISISSSKIQGNGISSHSTLVVHVWLIDKNESYFRK